MHNTETNKIIWRTKPLAFCFPMIFRNKINMFKGEGLVSALYVSLSSVVPICVLEGAIN